ncbi:ETS homologous factor [Toxocara canis]|uniref:ETS homologous factor n=1 Tax=Toxocara canis TaxID=6265 RepID=A0A0B2VLA3_TOXCA|nr:ETS homologous factor [Toxocara canis]
MRRLCGTGYLKQDVFLILPSYDVEKFAFLGACPRVAEIAPHPSKQFAQSLLDCGTALGATTSPCSTTAAVGLPALPDYILAAAFASHSQLLAPPSAAPPQPQQPRGDASPLLVYTAAAAAAAAENSALTASQLLVATNRQQQVAAAQHQQGQTNDAASMCVQLSGPAPAGTSNNTIAASALSNALAQQHGSAASHSTCGQPASQHPFLGNPLNNTPSVTPSFVHPSAFSIVNAVACSSSPQTVSSNTTATPSLHSTAHVQLSQPSPQQAHLHSNRALLEQVVQPARPQPLVQSVNINSPGSQQTGQQVAGVHNQHMSPAAAAAALYPQLMCLPVLLDRFGPHILRSHMSPAQFKPIPNNERVDLARFRAKEPQGKTVCIPPHPFLFKPIPNNERVDLARFRAKEPQGKTVCIPPHPFLFKPIPNNERVDLARFRAKEPQGKTVCIPPHPFLFKPIPNNERVDLARFRAKEPQGKTVCIPPHPFLFKPIPNNERVDLARFRAKEPQDWSMEDVIAWMLDVAKRNHIPFEDLEMQKFASCTGPLLLLMTEQNFKDRDPNYGSLLFSEFRKLVTEESFIDDWMRAYKDSEDEQQPSTSRVFDPARLSASNAYNFPSSTPAPLSPSVLLSHQQAISSSAQQPVASPLPPTAASTSKLQVGASSSSDFDSPACSEDTALHGVNMKIRKNKDGKPRKRSQHTKGNKLWEFIRDALKDPSTCPSVVRWEDPIEGVFRIVESEKLARLWGEKKNNQKMTYEKLSRAMRTYYEKQILVPVPKTGLYPKKLVYKFGPSAHGWDAPLAVKMEHCA